MFDIKRIHDDPQGFDAGLARRGLAPAGKRLIALDTARRDAVTALQIAQEQRNTASKAIGKTRQAGDEAGANALIEEVAQLKSTIQSGEAAVRDHEARLAQALSQLPNIPFDDVPEGASDADNVEVHRFAEKPAFAFSPKEHFELGEALGLMDFETAARLSGSRFVVLRGALARLERALAQFMLDVHTGEFGYTEIAPPILVRDAVMFGTGQLPKFADDQFRTEDGRWLIPTAEVPLTNLVREQILDSKDLPLRVTAYTPCFRLEAGAAGKDTRGMLRQHQFSKVELVSITTPEQSRDELERMRQAAEEILKRLDIHYRVVSLCAGDLGFSAHKTYDIEAWLPGQGAYREISSCSLCGDFQARRMNARFRAALSKAPSFVHTLNGSGLAVGRTLIALMETYQNEEGSITLPSCLAPYMGGLARIEPPELRVPANIAGS